MLEEALPLFNIGYFNCKSYVKCLKFKYIFYNVKYQWFPLFNIRFGMKCHQV